MIQKYILEKKHVFSARAQIAESHLREKRAGFSRQLCGDPYSPHHPLAKRKARLSKKKLESGIEYKDHRFESQRIFYRYSNELCGTPAILVTH